MTRCVGVTDDFLIRLVQNLNLVYLNLYALPYLKCSFLQYFKEKGENCKLEFLDLCGNQNIKDDVFTIFEGSSSIALRKLKYLNMVRC